MPAPSDAHTISVTIPRPPGEVYAYVTDPRNLPAWAAGLATSVERRDGRWVVDSGEGEWTVEFVPENDLGVADHLVTLPDGRQQLNPMRVLPNGDGSEVTFTIFRAEIGDDHDEWAHLIATIRDDLLALRTALAAAP
ncbi:MAG: SRPBCC family protein [Patulibacter minatonensis]